MHDFPITVSIATAEETQPIIEFLKREVPSDLAGWSDVLIEQWILWYVNHGFIATAKLPALSTVAILMGKPTDDVSKCERFDEGYFKEDGRIFFVDFYFDKSMRHVFELHRAMEEKHGSKDFVAFSRQMGYGRRFNMLNERKFMGRIFGVKQ